MYLLVRNVCVVALNLVIAVAYLGLLAVYGTLGMSLLIEESALFVVSLIEVIRYFTLTSIVLLFVCIMVGGAMGSFDTIRKLFPGKV